MVPLLRSGECFHPSWEAVRCLLPTVAPSHQEHSPVLTSITNDELCLFWNVLPVEPEEFIRGFEFNAGFCSCVAVLLSVG